MADERPADLVIRGADVYHGDQTGTWTRSVAVAGDRIVATGPAADELAAGASAVLDGAGLLVLPGFVDAHVHPTTGGRGLLTADQHDQPDGAAELDAVGRYAAAHPELAWITGGGWQLEHHPGGLPRREALDAVTGDRPAFLFNRDLHGAWVNSAALRAGGIDARTPDPPDGRVERDPVTGEPTGVLHEGAAYRFEAQVVPRPSRSDWQQAILAGQEHLRGLGITGWQDAWVTADQHAAYRALVRSGELTARVVGALWWDRYRGLEQIQDLLDLRAESPSGRYRATTVKIMVDGILENGTGALLAPYLNTADRPPLTEPTGLLYVEPDLLTEAVRQLDALEFQIHLHAIGDRAVRVSLDAIEAAVAANGFRDLRHHIAHIQIIDPADLPRFAALRVTANMQAFWAQHEPQMDEFTVPVLGAERSALQYPFRTLHELRTDLAMGSDWSVTTADPLAQLEVAVTRRSPEHRDRPPFQPGQALPLPVALAAFTAGSAHVNHDDDAGRIDAGRRADLVVLDRNILREPPEQIADARVRWTIAAGRIVYSA